MLHAGHHQMAQLQILALMLLVLIIADDIVRITIAIYTDPNHLLILQILIEQPKSLRP